MEIALWHKFSQNEDLKRALLATGDAELIHYTTDEVWGIGNGPDYKGRNEAGKALERVRSALHNASSTDIGSRAGCESCITATRHRRHVLFSADHNPEFTTSSPHPIVYNSKEYPTSGHLYHAFKYMDHRPDLAENIRTSSKSAAHTRKQDKTYSAYRHPNWDGMKIQKMEIVLWHKFTQHDDLKQRLLTTGNAELINYSGHDFWGVGTNQKGWNESGKLLERLRGALRNN